MAAAIPTIQTGDGFTLIVQFSIKPDSIDLFLSQFKRAVELASAEPECMSFQVLRDPKTPGKFKAVENWSKSWAWFVENQLTKPYMTAYVEATQPLWAGERVAEVWERMEGSFWTKAREGVFEKI